MPEIRFYHLTRKSLEEALPDLHGRSLDRGWRAVVKARSEERTEALNQHLWTFDDRAFLPHGSEKDGRPGLQPIWLTMEDENPNGAQVLFLADGADTANSALFETVCVLFDGRDDEAVARARGQWKVFKDAGHPMTYWQQNERGGWEKKQETAGAGAS